jgi:hypothetical protein
VPELQEGRLHPGLPYSEGGTVVNNYARGRRFEYRAKCFLEKQGFIVFRTAGSHSPEVGIMSIAS